MSKSYKRHLPAKEAAMNSHQIGIYDSIMRKINEASKDGKRTVSVIKSDSPLVKAKIKNLGYEIFDTGIAWHISW